jgi:hypothetical protein
MFGDWATCLGILLAPASKFSNMSHTLSEQIFLDRDRDRDIASPAFCCCDGGHGIKGIRYVDLGRAGAELDMWNVTIIMRQYTRSALHVLSCQMLLEF